MRGAVNPGQWQFWGEYDGIGYLWPPMKIKIANWAYNRNWHSFFGRAETQAGNNK